MPIDEKESSGNERIAADLRAHGGRSTVPPFVDSNLLLLTSIGATSGQQRTNPLGYTRDGERYIVVGSNSGRGEHPVWLPNILANPLVTVEAAGETFQARATVTEGAERRRLLDAHQADIPIFVKYEEMTDRELPVVILERIAKG
jgi:deazaflavin-dependent oxidoreductase (nitroreductase family)